MNDIYKIFSQLQFVSPQNSNVPHCYTVTAVLEKMLFQETFQLWVVPATQASEWKYWLADKEI